jgi:Rrf2 family protein
VELSCKTEYALLALLELASQYQQGEPLQIRQIADKQLIPDRYLEQLLATMRRGGLIKSLRGAKGGYLLAREPWKIDLFEIVKCLEGAERQAGSGDIVPKTVESAIVMEVWREVDAGVDEVLQRYTLQDLCDRKEARRQLDIMYYI